MTLNLKELNILVCKKNSKSETRLYAVGIAPQIRQQRLRELEAELKETKENLELAAQVGQGLIEINGNLNREIERLNKDIEKKLEEKLAEVRKEIDNEIGAEVAKKDAEITLLARQMEELQEENRRLQTERDEFEMSFLRGAGEVAASNERIKFLESELEKRDNESENLKKINEKRAREITELKKEKEDLTKKLADAEEKLANQDAILRRRQQENRDLVNERDNLKEKNSELNDYCLKQHNQLNSLTENYNKLQDENEELKRELVSRSARPSFSSEASSRTLSLYGSDRDFKEIRDYFYDEVKRNEKSSTTPDESHSEKETKSRQNSAPGDRGRGRGNFKRPSVSDYEGSHSDSNRHPQRQASDESSYYAESPTNSMLIEDTASTSYLDDLLKESKELVGEQEIEIRKLKKQIAELEKNAKADKERIDELRKNNNEAYQRTNELNQKLADNSQDEKIAEQRKIIIQALLD
ncbi:14675_t:CDS:2 [Racocetra fulgida]|uniref:14675_t:CDS:1 n=1 Tax=Racocetra fulgida TaxID=60492 RepID=A0A9N9AS21_9GLOM|nr:14675_t:CDS:2 [Racocetra fulgida]